MTKKEISQIRLECKSLSDKELEAKAYDAIYDSLGSEVDAMIDLGYDSSDIADREKYESFASDYADLLYAICDERGISLFGE